MANPCKAPADAKKAYAKRLPPQLVKDHGRKHRYTQSEIDQSIGNAALPVDWACWGYVMFLDQPTFEKLHADEANACNYDSMHLEMGGYLAESAKTGGWLQSGFDWSLFSLGSWDWPEISDLFDFLPDIGDVGDIGDIEPS